MWNLRARNLKLTPVSSSVEKENKRLLKCKSNLKGTFQETKKRSWLWKICQQKQILLNLVMRCFFFRKSFLFFCYFLSFPPNNIFLVVGTKRGMRVRCVSKLLYLRSQFCHLNKIFLLSNASGSCRFPAENGHFKKKPKINWEHLQDVLPHCLDDIRREKR